MEPQDIDLAELDTKKGAAQGFELTLKHPTTGAPLAAMIAVLGADSDAYQGKLRELQQRRLERAQRTRKLNGTTPEELDADALELLASVTVGWSGLKEHGQLLECTPANALSVYRRLPWIREQVDAAVADRGNFLPRPPSS